LSAALRDTRKIQIDWSQVEDLGRVSDRAVARRLSVSEPTVRRARQSLGIKPSWQPVSREDFIAAGAGKATDAEVGERLGLSREAVKERRVALGIKAFDSQRARMRRARTEARRLAATARREQRKPTSPIGIDWDREPLGKMMDRQLAVALGVSVNAVFAARAKRGIPAFKKSAPAAPGPRQRPVYADLLRLDAKQAVLLRLITQQKSDTEIASLIGCEEVHVRARKLELEHRIAKAIALAPQDITLSKRTKCAWVRKGDE